MNTSCSSMIWLRRSILLVSCLLLLAGTAAAADKIKLGSQPYISHAGLFIAVEKGYFSAEDLDVDLDVSRASGTQMLTALVAGDYDIVGAGLTVATFNAALRGIDIRLVADKGGNKGDRSYAWIVARKDLVDAGKIKSVADLKGLRIGTPGIGSSNWIELVMLLEQAGVRADEVKFVQLNAPDRVSSLVAGTVDAIIVPEPFVAKAKSTGKAVELVPAGDLGVFLEAVLVTTGENIRNRKDVLKRFLRAYVKGARDYLANPNEPANVAAIAKHTGLGAETIEATHPFYMDPSGRVPEDVVEKQMNWLVEQKLIARPVPLEQLIDNSLLPD